VRNELHRDEGRRRVQRAGGARWYSAGGARQYRGAPSRHSPDWRDGAFCDERDRHPWVPSVSSGGRQRRRAVSRFVLNGAPVPVQHGAGHRPRRPRFPADPEHARARLSRDLVNLTRSLGLSNACLIGLISGQSAAIRTQSWPSCPTARYTPRDPLAIASHRHVSDLRFG
jgi:hypothetical protein